MKLTGFSSVPIVLAGLIGVALAATSVSGQRQMPPDQGIQGAMVLQGRGSQIGVSARDLDAAETNRHKIEGGVYLEDVFPDSPASKAGLKKGDIVTSFDGERVRSARQFSRLVQETPPGRRVTAAIVRDQRTSEIAI